MKPMTKVLGVAIKHLANIGLGRIPGMRPLYRFAWMYFGPKGIRIADVDGIKLYVPCCDWAVAPTMIFSHVWEPAETKVVKWIIKEGMTVVDAGAYIGYYSVLASELVGETGRVIAFEPSPESIDLLHKNVRMNHCENVEIQGKAVSDKTGFTSFNVSPTNLSGSSMFVEYGNSRKQQIIIPTVTLDEALGDMKVDFIKMDVEGGEVKVLQGMTRVIKNNPSLKMMVEVLPEVLEKSGSNTDEYVALLQKDFRLRIICGDGLTGEVGLSDIKVSVKASGSVNLLCERR